MRNESKQTDDKEQKATRANAEKANDEIDLWQLLILVLKYKIQVFVFLFIGFSFGIGLTWKTYTVNKSKVATIPSGRAEEIEFYKSEMVQLETDRVKQTNDILKSIDNVVEGKGILEVTSAEFQYMEKNSGFDISTINIRNAEWINPAMAARQTDYSVYLIVKATNTSILKSRLKKIHVDHIKLLNELDQAKFDNLEQKLVEREIEGGHRLKTAQNSTQIEKRQGIIGYEDRIDMLEKAAIEKSNEMKFILFSLSEQVYASITREKIPLSLWYMLKNRILATMDQTQKEEYKHAQHLKNEITASQNNQLFLRGKINNFKELLILLKYEQTIPSHDSRTTFLKESLSISKTPSFIHPFDFLNKTMIICLAISLVLGIFSAYLRYFASNLADGDFASHKEELFQALKTWKL